MTAEFGWMIEIGLISKPEFYTGVENIWSLDPNEGLRFARQMDGQKFAMAFFKELQFRVRQHGWT